MSPQPHLGVGCLGLPRVQGLPRTQTPSLSSPHTTAGLRADVATSCPAGCASGWAPPNDRAHDALTEPSRSQRFLVGTIRNSPLRVSTLAYPPNAFLEPDFWWSRDWLTERVLDRLAAFVFFMCSSHRGGHEASTTSDA